MAGSIPHIIGQVITTAGFTVAALRLADGVLVAADELLNMLPIPKLLVDGTQEPVDLFFGLSLVCVHSQLLTMGHSIVPFASMPLVACMGYPPLGLVSAVDII